MKKLIANNIENCKLCLSPIAVTVAYKIKKAPRSVNQLPTNKLNKNNCTRNLSLWECPECGHIQLKNECITDNWREVFTAAGFSKEMLKARRKLFAKMLKKCSSNNIIEIGCGAGHFLPVFREVGFKACGLEWSDTQCEKARRTGLYVIQGHVLEGALNKRRIDNFAIINYLEHVKDPRKMLSLICKSCRPNSIGLVEVPNFSRDLKFSKSHNLVAEHLSYFTEKSLKLILEISGFEIINIEKFWDDNDIIAWVRPRILKDFNNWDDKNTTLKIFKEYISNNNIRKFAIWGASHQTLTLLSMIKSSDSKKISFIVDSSTDKQGKIDPVRGIKIISPKDMMSKNIDNILIIAGGYSDEISKLLKSLNYSGRISILRDTFIKNMY